MPNPILNNFRTKYPQYKDVDDSTLASGIIAKYPQYKDALSDVLTPKAQAATQPPQDMSNFYLSPQEKIGRAVLAPFQQAGQALGQAQASNQRGDIPAQIMQSQTAAQRGAMALTGVPSAINAIKELGPVGQFAGQGLEGVMNLVPQGLGMFSNLIDTGLKAAGMSDKARNLGLSPQASQAGQEALTNIASTLAAPAIAKGAESIPQAIGATARAVIPENLQNRLEGAAQKPPYNPKKGIQQYDRQIQTTIREDLPPTRGGIKSVGNILDGLDHTAKPLQANAAKAGVTEDFSPNGYQQFLENSKEQYKNDADFPEKAAAIDEMKSRVARLAEQYPNGQVPFDKAWQFKSSLQDMAQGKYDQDAGYKLEAAKTAAHGLLDDMISKVPELREIGLRQRDLIEAQSMIARRVAAKESSKIVNVRNLKVAGAAATGGLIGGVPGAAIGGALDAAIESPYLQHKAAVALDRLRSIGKSPTSPYGNYTPQPFPSSGQAPSASTPGTPTQPPPEPMGTAPPSFTPPSGTAVPPFQESTMSPRMDLNEKLPPQEPNWEGFSIPRGYRNQLEERLGKETVTKYGTVKDLSDQDLWKALMDEGKAPSSYLNEIHPKELHELVKAGKISRAQAAQAMTERGKVHVDMFGK